MRTKPFFLMLEQDKADFEVLSVDFAIGTLQMNNSTNAKMKIYVGERSVGLGTNLADYEVPEFSFVEIPIESGSTKVTISWIAPTSQYDPVRVNLLEERRPYFVQSNPPNGATGSLQNVTIIGSLPSGANTIGDVGISAARTTIDFAKQGTPITGQSLESGGSGMAGWLSQLYKKVADFINVKITAPLPAGSNGIGTVGVTSLPAIPAGANKIGSVDIANQPTVNVASLPALPAGANDIGKVVITSMPPVEVSNEPVKQSHEQYEATAGTTASYYDMAAAGRSVNRIVYLVNDGDTDLFVNFDQASISANVSSGLNGTLRLKPGESLNDVPRKSGKIGFIRATGSGVVRFMGV